MKSKERQASENQKKMDMYETEVQVVILKRMGGNKTITVCLGDNVNALYKRVAKMTGLSKKDFVLYIGDTALDKPTQKLNNAGVRDGNEIRVGIGGVGGGKRGIRSATSYQ